MNLIYISTWKNLESICLENSKLRIVVIPGLGGKIASVYLKDRAFEAAAVNKEKEYCLPNKNADFSKFDGSGIDDAFPNIVEAEVLYNGENQYYPDHGEIWSSAFAYTLEEDKICLSYRSRQFPYIYKKWISLEGDSVLIHYEIENESNRIFPCIWTFHGLFRYEEDMQLIYPQGIERMRNVLSSRELGEEGVCIPLMNDTYDFSKVPPIESKTMVKYYAEEKVKYGACGYRYPKQGVECILEYDANKLPYLGVWITAGGFRGDYNLAIEPSTGYYDDIRIAEKNKSLHLLCKDSPLVFDLKITVREYLI